jgi:hypothetical protein
MSISRAVSRQIFLLFRDGVSGYSRGRRSEVNMPQVYISFLKGVVSVRKEPCAELVRTSSNYTEISQE